MKSGHQQVNILERKVETPADKRIGADTIVHVNTLPDSMINLQEIFDAAFQSDIQDDRDKDIIQGLGSSIGNP